MNSIQTDCEQQPYRFKVDSILVDGTQEIIPSRLTVLIGPNNAGKSRLLKDIRSAILGGADKDHPGSASSSTIVNLSMPTTFDDFDNSYHLSRHVVKNREVIPSINIAMRD